LRTRDGDVALLLDAELAGDIQAALRRASMHDTLQPFGGSLDELRRLWREVVRPTMPPTTARRATRVGGTPFAGVSDTIREAARIPQVRRLVPGDVQRACAYGPGEILA
jgi:hypothetical protein